MCEGLKTGICTVEVTEPVPLSSQTSSESLDLALWILSARVTKCADNQKRVQILNVKYIV